MQSTTKFALYQFGRGVFPWRLTIARRRSMFLRSLPYFGLAFGAAIAGGIAVMMIPQARRMDIGDTAKKVVGDRIRSFTRTARQVLPAVQVRENAQESASP